MEKRFEAMVQFSVEFWLKNKKIVVSDVMSIVSDAKRRGIDTDISAFELTKFRLHDMIWFERSEMKRKSDIWKKNREKANTTTRFRYFFAFNELCVVEIGNSKENKFDIIAGSGLNSKKKGSGEHLTNDIIILTSYFQGYEQQKTRTRQEPRFFLLPLLHYNFALSPLRATAFSHRIKIRLCSSFWCIISPGKSSRCENPKAHYTFALASLVVVGTTKLMPQTEFRSQGVSPPKNIIF